MSGEKTEWDDILVKHGIKAPTVSAEEIQAAKDEHEQLMYENSEEYKQQQRLENASKDQLDELEDEIEERLLAEYRRKRVNEMKAMEALAKYGTVRQISEPDYKREVNEAGPGVCVVLHLFKDGVMDCDVTNRNLTVLARKFPATKFLKIYSQEAIHNYPDRNLPTLLVYKDGENLKQLIGVGALGGKNARPEDLEWTLAEHGILETELEENPAKYRSSVNRSSDRRRRDEDSDDD